MRTHLAIIATGYNDVESMRVSPVNLRDDIDLVKAGLLYADDVEILSLGHVFLRNFEEFANGPDRNFYEMLATTSDETLNKTTGGADPKAVRAMARDALKVIDRDGNDSALGEAIKGIRDRTMARLRAASDSVRAESGVLDLEQAFQRGVVRYNDRVPAGKDAQLVMEAYQAEIKRYLEDPTKFVLLDTELTDLVEAMIEAGKVTPPRRAISNAGEAALGAGLLSKLPALPNASIDQVMEVRNDLDDPLTRYRSKVADLRGHMQTEPFDKHIQGEIDGIWRQDVAPALLDIRNAMADHTLAKELLTSIGTDITKFVKDGIFPAGLAIYAAFVHDIGTALTGASALAGLAAPALLKSSITSRTARTQAQREDLYYLYEVDRRLIR